jgi:hypothetical protein
MNSGGTVSGLVWRANGSNDNWNLYDGVNILFPCLNMTGNQSGVWLTAKILKTSSTEYTASITNGTQTDTYSGTFPSSQNFNTTTGMKIGISVESGSDGDTTEANLDYIGMETQPRQIF